MFGVETTTQLVELLLKRHIHMVSSILLLIHRLIDDSVLSCILYLVYSRSSPAKLEYYNRMSLYVCYGLFNRFNSLTA